MECIVVYVQVLALEPVNVILFEKKMVFADVIH
jgi:hypothetical protein